MTQHVNVIATPKDSWDDLVNPGDFMWDSEPKSIIFVCPCGGHKGEYDEIRTSVPVAGDRAWEWNGDRVRPTLSPSIRRIEGCKWHGHLTDGVFIPCGDSGT